MNNEESSRLANVAALENSTSSSENGEELERLTPYLDQILAAIRQGRLIPFFGAGVNRCGRPPEAKAAPDDYTYLPDGKELARYLIRPWEAEVGTQEELDRVTQFVILRESDGPVFEKLNELFARNYKPTQIHSFFARLPTLLQEKGYQVSHPLILTTNYDDVMERAFQAAQQPHHVLYYRIDSLHRGKFFHIAYDAEGEVESPVRRPGDSAAPAQGASQSAWPIDDPDSYLEASLDERPVIVKLHGAIERYPIVEEDERGSFVIAEDHYVAYLTGSDIRKLLPIDVRERFKKGGFLFLGYGLKDWTVRLMLHRIAVEQLRKYRSWAVLLGSDQLDKEIWASRKVDLLNVSLESFIAELEIRLQQLPETPPS